MRFVTRTELMEMPVGTIFREFKPMHLVGEDWQRFEGKYGGDFLVSSVGPRCLDNGIYGTIGLPDELKKLMGSRQDCHFLVINTDAGREGLFDDKARYVVLDREDIEQIILQLTGGIVEQNQRFCVVPEDI